MRLAGDSRISTAAVIAAAQGPGTGVWLASATTFSDAVTVEVADELLLG